MKSKLLTYYKRRYAALRRVFFAVHPVRTSVEGKKERRRSDLKWLRYGPLAGCCKHGNESSGSINEGNFSNTS